MVIRTLLRYLTHNEELIQKIADSYPIRRAAQLTAFFIHKGKEIGDEKIEKLRESDVINRFQNEMQMSASKIQEKASSAIERTNKFADTFSQTLKREWEKAEKQLEEQKRLDEEAKKKR